jgi:glycosyltransferase involved in cell wall biosynthesis
MHRSFEQDDYPGEPRILFIGLGHSTHTHAWIDLLQRSSLNVRLFCTTNEAPPAGWRTRTYVLAKSPGSAETERRSYLWNHAAAGYRLRRRVARARGDEFDPGHLVADWLVSIIRGWKPHIVHTLGLDAAHFYFPARERVGNDGPKWVLQTRGGSDLQLAHLDPERHPGIAHVLQTCDQLLSDNVINYRIARDLGIRAEQLATIGTVPGTGGIDINPNWSSKPSARRIIVWPKAFESPWSKSLPVLEAFKICWQQIQPGRIEMLATCPQTLMHFWSLPDEVRSGCVIHDRIPRAEALGIIAQARVTLSPSLVDGVPNVMYEAMAMGALPIVSPLESIATVVKADENVLFARNLYPDEIAAALVRAMADDNLVDSVAERNLALVKTIADRETIRPRVVNFYRELARS